MQNEKKVSYFKLEPELAQSVVNYLATRPYQEVFQLMPHIMNLEGVLSEEEAPQEEDDKEILDSLTDEG